MEKQIKLYAYAPINSKKIRLDQIAKLCFPDYSRSLLQQWIAAGDLLVDGKKRKPKDILVGGESLSLEAKLFDITNAQPEDINLNIVYEDDQLLVINKATNMVVHPGAGNYAGTIMNAILHYCPGNIKIPRAGIVHRLDKDTTGLMIIAKTLKAHYYLIDCIKKREITREYEAVVHGTPDKSGYIEQPIGRHPKHRTKMAVVSSGKSATTHFKVIKYYNNYSYVKLKLETGRTHQIRVHMSYIGHPLVGDLVYSSPKNIKGNAQLISNISKFSRQALHAKRISFIHPVSHKLLKYEVELPRDFQQLLFWLDSYDLL